MGGRGRARREGGMGLEDMLLQMKQGMRIRGVGPTGRMSERGSRKKNGRSVKLRLQ